MHSLQCLQASCLRIPAWESASPPASHRFLSALEVPCGGVGKKKPRHSPSTTEGYSLSLSLFNISSFWNILSGRVGTARRCLSKSHLFQCFTYFPSRLLPLAILNTGLVGDGGSRGSDGREWLTPRAPSVDGRAGLGWPETPGALGVGGSALPGPLLPLVPLQNTCI